MNENDKKDGLFSIQGVDITPAANEAFRAVEVISMLSEHSKGNWGDCSPDEAKSNDAAFAEGKSIRSVFKHAHATCVIETNPERTMTSISLSSEV